VFRLARLDRRDASLIGGEGIGRKRAQDEER
jgi:hypothetical protein